MAKKTRKSMEWFPDLSSLSRVVGKYAEINSGITRAQNCVIGMKIESQGSLMCIVDPSDCFILQSCELSQRCCTERH